MASPRLGVRNTSLTLLPPCNSTSHISWCSRLVAKHCGQTETGEADIDLLQSKAKCRWVFRSSHSGVPHLLITHPKIPMQSDFVSSACPKIHQHCSAMSDLFPWETIASHSKYPFSHSAIVLIATHSKDSHWQCTPSITLAAQQDTSEEVLWKCYGSVIILTKRYFASIHTNLGYCFSTFSTVEIWHHTVKILLSKYVDNIRNTVSIPQYFSSSIVPCT